MTAYYKSHQRSTRTPQNIFNWGTIHLCDGLLLLDLVQENRGGGAEDQAGSPTVEDLARLYGRVNGLHDRIGWVANFDEPPRQEVNNCDRGKKRTYIPVQVYSKRQIDSEPRILHSVHSISSHPCSNISTSLQH
jgi:hypothetical protein